MADIFLLLGQSYVAPQTFLDHPTPGVRWNRTEKRGAPRVVAIALTKGGELTLRNGRLFPNHKRAFLDATFLEPCGGNPFMMHLLAPGLLGIRQHTREVGAKPLLSEKIGDKGLTDLRKQVYDEAGVLQGVFGNEYGVTLPGPDGGQNAQPNVAPPRHRVRVWSLLTRPSYHSKEDLAVSRIAYATCFQQFRKTALKRAFWCLSNPTMSYAMYTRPVKPVGGRYKYPVFDLSFSGWGGWSWDYRPEFAKLSRGQTLRLTQRPGETVCVSLVLHNTEAKFPTYKLSFYDTYRFIEARRRFLRRNDPSATTYRGDLKAKSQKHMRNWGAIDPTVLPTPQSSRPAKPAGLVVRY